MSRELSLTAVKQEKFAKVRVGQGGVLEYQYTRKKNRQNTPKYPKFLQIYPKIIEAFKYFIPEIRS